MYFCIDLFFVCERGDIVFVFMYLFYFILYDNVRWLKVVNLLFIILNIKDYIYVCLFMCFKFNV